MMVWKLAPLMLHILLSSQTHPVLASWATTAGTAAAPSSPDERERRRRAQGDREEESSTAPASTAALPSSRTASNRLIVRGTKSHDIPAVAQLLAKATTASAVPKKKTIAGWNWKSAIDNLWAKSDMESLLTCRQQAIQYGRKALRNSQQQLLLASRNENDGGSSYSESDRLRLLWSQSGAAGDKLRQTIEQASQETGENNVWRYHNMALPPPDSSWLQHLQLSVVNVVKDDDSSSSSSSPPQITTKEVLVGFCEVAMLANPTIRTRDDENDDNAPPCFTPAITNLAIDPEWRRRGIATRLLRTAERYVKHYWRGVASISSSSSSNDLGEEEDPPLSPSMGLYVEKDNHDALALYRSLGYETTVTCDGGDILGEMWYMTRQLSSNSDEKEPDDEEEQADSSIMGLEG